jgi:UDP-N-acetylmuramoyl-tripeptide--D-alanyl-D-alanine ligase
MPAAARFGGFEIGMHHAGEITPLVAMVRPHIAIVTNVAPVHLEHFSSVAAIAEAKGEIFSGLSKGGVALINRDIEEFGILERCARLSPAGHIVSFGSDAQLVDVAPAGEGSRVHARVFGREISFTLGAPGRHLAMNAMAVLAACKAVGLKLEDAAEALAEFSAPAGRGARHELQAADGAFLLIDESYNANPASMRAALAVAGATPVGPNGRRIAVLGDMLELGPESARLHGDLAEAVVENHIDIVLAAGTMMKNLHDALPARAQGAWRSAAAELQPVVLDCIRAGDVVVVKGSNGSRMGSIVAAMKKAFDATAQMTEQA